MHKKTQTVAFLVEKANIVSIIENHGKLLWQYCGE